MIDMLQSIKKNPNYNFMAKAKKKKLSEPTIQDFYPKANPEQLEQAEFNLEEYVRNSLAIYEGIIADPELYKKFQDLLSEEKIRSTQKLGKPGARMSRKSR